MAKGKKTFIPNMFDKYAFKALYIPAIIIAIPLMVLSSVLNIDELKEIFKYADKFLIVGNFGLNMIAIIFLTHVVRTMGKYLIEYPLFQNGLRFPTTEMLLWKTKLISKEMKTNLHEKIKKDFNLKLPVLDEELNDNSEARLLARDAVNQIRSYVGNEKRTKQYNIYYGLFRNLTGGLPLGLIFTILALIFVDGHIAKIILWTYLGGILFYALIAIPLLRMTGKHYAQYLFTEYLTKENKND
jgi:hypothetical protein